MRNDANDFCVAVARCSRGRAHKAKPAAAVNKTVAARSYLFAEVVGERHMGRIYAGGGAAKDANIK